MVLDEIRWYNDILIASQALMKIIVIVLFVLKEKKLLYPFYFQLLIMNRFQSVV